MYYYIRVVTLFYVYFSALYTAEVMQVVSNITVGVIRSRTAAVYLPFKFFIEIIICLFLQLLYWKL
jgi:hypothetical protein